MYIGTVVLYNTMCGTVIGTCKDKLTLATSEGTVIDVPSGDCQTVASAKQVLESLGGAICKLAQ